MPKRDRPTMRAVAELAGVSPSTVSIVLNGRKRGARRISAATERRVREAVEALDYVPNQAARQLRRQSTERVCVVLPHLGTPYDTLLLRALQAAAMEHGYAVVVNVSETPEQTERVLRQVRAGLADALVLGMGFESEHHGGIRDQLANLAAAGIPCIVCSNHFHSEHHDTVLDGEATSSYRAVRYLIDGGHRRIGFIGHTLAAPDRYLRHGSLLRALRDAGIEPDPQLATVGAATRAEAFASARALLALEAPPTALYCGSDIAAISALAAARGAGLRVPDDLAVIGTGNVPEGEFSCPPLTTVGPATRDFEPVARLLFARLRGDDAPPRTIEQRWELIVRASA